MARFGQHKHDPDQQRAGLLQISRQRPKRRKQFRTSADRNHRRNRDQETERQNSFYRKQDAADWQQPSGQPVDPTQRNPDCQERKSFANCRAALTCPTSRVGLRQQLWIIRTALQTLPNMLGNSAESATDFINDDSVRAHASINLNALQVTA